MASEGDLEKMKRYEKNNVFEVMSFISYKIDYQKEYQSKTKD